jgi:DNA repair photolyase
MQPSANMEAPPIRKGRGVSGNCGNRFEPLDTEAFDDGWGSIAEESLAPPPVVTSLTRDSSRSAIAWNESPDLGFDRSVNPYRGCEHGCVYCYARPSHAYLGYSPGLDFETKLTFKPDVARLLERELRKPGYVPRPIALGSNTDPYQPVERTLALTRSVLEVLERFGHPFSIVTKSAGVVRDADILARMAQKGLVRVWLSVTTLDSELARRMEPRAATPQRRLATIASLNAAGIPTGVLAAPMIPGLNDCELERILEAAAAAGARDAGYVLLRLPLELRPMFETWLHQHYPQRARHVLNLIRETRAGALNDSRFTHRFRGQGVYADMLAQRFARITRRLGLTDRQSLQTGHFTPPAREEAQLMLFQ